MELRIRLDLPDPLGELTLETAETKAHGQLQKRVPLPFDEREASILFRVFELNLRTDLKRRFSAKEARTLAGWRVLTDDPPADEPLVISGGGVYHEQLQDFVRGKLRETLFEPIREALAGDFVLVHDRGEGVLHVQLEMRSDEVTLFQLPWELLNSDNSFNGEIHISRYIRYRQSPRPMTAAAQLRLLVVHSEPANLQQLGLRDKVYIKNGLRAASFPTGFRIETVEPATIEALGDALLHQREFPTVVHFAGHGDFGWCCEGCGALRTCVDQTRCAACNRPFPAHVPPCGYLAFAREGSADPYWVSADKLRDTFKLGNVQLAVLNACKSALGRRDEDVFNGVAQRLMNTVPAVVATPFPLENQGAHRFAHCFYEGLGNGLPLVEALHQVRLRMRPEFPHEWYRPVLYLRSDQQDGGCLL